MSNITIILGTVLVVLIVYMLYQSYFDGEQKLLSRALLKDAVDVDGGSVSTPTASNFSYGIWIYVQQWAEPGSAEEHKRIFARKDELGLYLDKDATLKVRFADDAGKDVTAATAATTTTTAGAGTTTTTTNYSEIILTNNFPIQKWVHVGLVVDGNKFDGYIDGKMVKSIGLSGIGITPSLTDGAATNGIEFGKDNTMASTLMIAEHKRRTYPMDPAGMWDLYMKGNGANGLAKTAGTMNVNLSILKDGVESSKLALF